MLKEWSEILSFTWRKKMYKPLQKYLLNEYKNSRNKLKIKTKLIFSIQNQEIIPSLKTQINETEKNEKYREIKFIQDPIVSIGSSVYIYGFNKIALIMYQRNELTWVIVAGDILHSTFKNLFNFVWWNATIL